MTWFLRSLAGLAFLWLIYVLSPYVSLYGLARAVEANDEASVRERVDFPALRMSLARQIASGYGKAAGAKDQSSLLGQAGTAAGASLIEPLLEPYVTPAAIMTLVRGGTPRFAGEAPSTLPGGEASVPTALSLDRLKAVFFASEWRGFRTFLFGVPLERAPAERFQLELHMNPDFTWQLVGLILPEPVLDRIVRELRTRQVGEETNPGSQLGRPAHRSLKARMT